MKQLFELKKQGIAVPNNVYQGQAQAVLSRLDEGGTIERQLQPSNSEVWDSVVNSFFGVKNEPYDVLNEDSFRQAIKERANTLRDPDVMKSFIELIKSSGKFDEPSQGMILKNVQKEFPESYTQAMQSLKASADVNAQYNDVLTKVTNTIGSAFIPSIALSRYSGGVAISISSSSTPP